MSGFFCLCSASVLAGSPVTLVVVFVFKLMCSVNGLAKGKGGFGSYFAAGTRFMIGCRSGTGCITFYISVGNLFNNKAVDFGYGFAAFCTYKAMIWTFRCFKLARSLMLTGCDRS